MGNITRRKTKIIATVGPATLGKEEFRNLVTDGVNVIRFNFSHMKYDDFSKTISYLREISEEIDRPVAVLVDIQGPKLRIGTLEKEFVVLKEGKKFVISTEDIIGNEDKVSCSFKEIGTSVEKGNYILLDDGRIKLEVLESDIHNVYTKVRTGGKLYSHKGMNLPGMKYKAGIFTEKDKKDLEFLAQYDFDYVALSFVESAKDIEHLRKILKRNNNQAKIIAKIERSDALVNIDEIIQASDGIMVARGDLGVEVSLEQVPIIQKDLIKRANRAVKPVIVATQMFESMIENDIPTRAEVSDVANAIYDGADAIMLSGETAMGKYPIETVNIMRSTAKEVDRALDDKTLGLNQVKIETTKGTKIENAICSSADKISDMVDASAIIVFTSRGVSPLLISKYRPRVPIIALTDNRKTWNNLALNRGVWSIYVPNLFDQGKVSRDLLAEAEKRVVSKGVVKNGETVVVVSGIPLGLGVSGKTSLIRVHQIGDYFHSI